MKILIVIDQFDNSNTGTTISESVYNSMCDEIG